MSDILRTNGKYGKPLRSIIREKQEARARERAAEYEVWLREELTRLGITDLPEGAIVIAIY